MNNLNKRLTISAAASKQDFAKVRKLVLMNLGRTARIEEKENSIVFLYKAVGNAEILDLSPEDLIKLGQGLKAMEWNLTITPIDQKTLEVQAWDNRDYSDKE